MKKGFTLVEVVTALAIMAIVGLIISSVYISIVKFEVSKREKNELKSIISNIHEIYLADPENWQKEYYRSYNQYFAGPVIADDQRLIYDRDFSLITTGGGSYVLYYDYGYNDNDEVYVLTITKIVKGNKELVSDIYLGRWKKGC